MRTILLLILFLPGILFSQENKYADIIYYDSNWNESSINNYTYYATFFESKIKYNQAFLVKVTDYYKSGEIQMTGYKSSPKSTERIGLFTFYNKNGKLKSKQLYHFNEMHEYFPEIKQYTALVEQCESTNKNFYVSFISKGHVKEAGYFDENNDPIGQWIEFNGKNLYYIDEYKGNRCTRTERTYFEKNKLWKVKHFEDGMKTGTWKYYDFSGNLKKEKIYVHDKLIEKKKYKKSINNYPIFY